MEASSESVTINQGVLLVDLDEKIYSRDSVIRTAYWFTDRCYIHIGCPRSDVFRIRFKLKPQEAHENPQTLEDLAGEFLNALLDHQLRYEIESETGRIRELLVAKAFAEAGVLEDTPPGEVSDPVDERQSANPLVQIERTT